MIKLHCIGKSFMFEYYTPQEVNKILPDTKRKFNLIITIRDQIVDIHKELQHMLDSDTSLEKYMLKKQELNTVISNLHKGIEELESMNILIKSIDECLLDFPSMRFNEEVWLCWKIEENEVKFWHGKNEGFVGRKPLSQSDDSLV